MNAFWKWFIGQREQTGQSRYTGRRPELETLEGRVLPATAVFQNGDNDPFTGAIYEASEDVAIQKVGVLENYGIGGLQVGGTTGVHSALDTLIRFPITSMAGEFEAITSVKLQFSISTRLGASQDVVDLYEIPQANQNWIEGRGLGTPAFTGESTARYRVYTPLPSDATPDLTPETGWIDVNGNVAPFFSHLSSGKTIIGSENFDDKGEGDVFVLEIDGTTTDLDALVQRWASGDNPGLLMNVRLNPGVHLLAFHSSESEDITLRPQLIIDYDPVVNTPPEVSILNAPAQGFEGTAVTLGSSVIDPNANDTHTYDWSVTKDGSPFASATTETFTFTPDDNALYMASLTVSDGTDTGSAAVRIPVLNVTPIADAGGPYEVDEGQTVLLTGTGLEPAGSSDTLSYEWDLDGDGTFETPGQVVTFDATNLQGPSREIVTLRVTDDDGASRTDSASVRVRDVNVAPVANPGGPYTVVTGFTTRLDGSLSTDENQSSESLDYEWDLDGDGIFGETGAKALRGNEVGINPVYNAQGLDAPLIRGVRLRVTDDQGLQDNAVTFVRVVSANVEDGVLRIGGTSGDDVITLTQVGPSTVATLNGRILGGYSSISRVEVQARRGNDLVDVDSSVRLRTSLFGDDGNDTLRGGSGDDLLVGGEGNDLFAGGAGFDAAFGQGGNDIAKSDVELFNGGLGQDGITFEGTSRSDQINVRWLPGPLVEAEINGQSIQVEYAEGETIFVFAGAGNDQVIMEESAGSRWTAELHGENGNDYLVGSSGNDRLFGGRGRDILDGADGNDVLVGGNGRDVLLGREGRDVLIGGRGSDVLLGGADDDLLIAALTLYDDNVGALDSIMQEWTSERSFEERTDNLRSGIRGENGETIALNESTVTDDRRMDFLLGGAERDWFFASALRRRGDLALDVSAVDLLEPIGR